MLDYRLLEACASVFEQGGFERAAQKLGLTQSAVSQRIRQLEDELGEVLVIRENPPRPTEIGERLLRHYRMVRELEEELAEELEPDRSVQYRPLRIGVNTDSLSVWLFDVLLPFLRKRQITIEIIEDEQDRVLDYLRVGSVAACVSPQAQSIQGCSSAPLGSLRYLLVATPGFRDRYFPEGISATSLRLAPLIQSDRKDSLQHRALAGLLGTAVPEGPAHFIPSTERYFDMVKAGLGFGLVSDIQAKAAILDGSLVELDQLARIEVPLYWHRWRRSSRLLDEVSSVISAGAAEVLAPTW